LEASRLNVLLFLVVACATVLLGFGPRASATSATAGPLTPESRSGIAGWTEVASYSENSQYADEGVATVSSPGHEPYELYRGQGSIPSNLKTLGWIHIGDPDAGDGIIFDAYQGPSSARSKMFIVTTPSGGRFEYRHTLARGELYNNSFVTISPDTQWMVAGEWGTMSHLQIYPTPHSTKRLPLTTARCGLSDTSSSTTRSMTFKVVTS
jgi:hypothetical protein